MEHLEEIALDTSDHILAKWFRYIDSTFVFFSQGPVRLEKFLYHLSGLRPTIKFSMGVEVNNTLPFLDIVVMKRGPDVTMKMYRKPTHTGSYLHSNPIGPFT
jgi:hypothetical protein